MKNQDKKTLSLVRDAAQALRNAALRTPEGERLGSEDDLVEQLKVSRPTLRQAAGLVAQEQLILIKRGVGGGYFASRPNSMAVAHMAAIFLQTREVRLEEIIHAIQPIRIELARLAAHNRDAAVLSQLDKFLQTERKNQDSSLHYRDFLKAEKEFGLILANMSNNKVLSLFLEILYDFASMLNREDDLYVNRPERVADYRKKRNRMAEAMLEGDEDAAALGAQRCSQSVMQWMLEDAARRKVTSLTRAGQETVLKLKSSRANSTRPKTRAKRKRAG